MERADQSFIRALPGNDKCIDCEDANPVWASVKFGTLFCLECSGGRRGLGVHVDFVRSITLDSWTEDQVAIMKKGGNSKCLSHFEKYGISKDLTMREKYTSEPAKLYKDMLEAEAKGEPLPDLTTKLATTAATEGSSTNPNLDDNSESLEDLVRRDPTVQFPQALTTVKNFLYLMSPYLRPSRLFGFTYPLLGGLYYMFSHNRMLRGTLMIVGTIPIIHTIGFLTFGTHMFMTKRKSPFKSSQNLLLDRIKSGRAKRVKDAFDIFLPSPNRNRKASERTYGILFFPGALVNHTAYATIASRLSDEGIVVAVISLEPTRFCTDVESNKRKALTAMYETLSSSDVTVDEWILSGHSAGAMVAMSLGPVMKPGISKMILCGVIENQFRSPTLKNDSFEILVVNGSKDGLINRGGLKAKEAFLSELPKNTSYFTIEGGNHSGFAHYGPQMSDGTRTITLDEQQDIFVQKVTDFLKLV